MVKQPDFEAKKIKPNVKKSNIQLLVYRVSQKKVGIYVPSGWKHYARCRKTLRQTVFPRETNFNARNGSKSTIVTC
jgi:hypothetical protein